MKRFFGKRMAMLTVLPVQSAPTALASTALKARGYSTGKWIVKLCMVCLLAVTHITANAQSPANGEPVSPPPLQTEFVYEAVVSIGGAVDVGATPSGHSRYIPITGGTFKGPRIQGVILAGGADWQTERPDEVTEVDALYSMRCDDGAVIIVHNSGVIAERGAYMRTAPRFEAPDGPHAWLNKAQFVGSVSGGPQPGTVTIRVFRVL